MCVWVQEGEDLFFFCCLQTPELSFFFVSVSLDPSGRDLAAYAACGLLTDNFFRTHGTRINFYSTKINCKACRQCWWELHTVSYTLPDCRTGKKLEFNPLSSRCMNSVKLNCKHILLNIWTHPFQLRGTGSADLWRSLSFCPRFSSRDQDIWAYYRSAYNGQIYRHTLAHRWNTVA